MNISSLEEFLAPMSQVRFLRDIYGVRAAYMPGAPGRFAQLLPWDDLNEILLQHPMSPSRFQLTKEGSVIEPKNYLRPDTDTYQFSLSGLSKQLREGATVMIDWIEETHRPLCGLSRMLERELGEYVHMSAYADWCSTRGGNARWDRHDIIVTQVSGRKHWRVFEPERRHPIEVFDAIRAKLPAGNPTWEGDLHAGDLLYIPRGWWHDAVAAGEPSLHLNIAMRQRTGLSLIDKMIERLCEREEIRADLPRLASLEEQQRYMVKCREIVAEVMQKLTLADYFRELDSMVAPRARPSFPWSAMPESQKISGQLWLHWLPPREVPIEETDDKVTLEAIGSKFSFEKVAGPILHNLASNLRIRFDDLCAAFPHAASDAMERFILELVSKGLIAVAEDKQI